MKNILLLIVSFIIISCSSNDNTISEDKIIGTWNLHKQTKNDVDDPQSDCEKESSLVYRKDNTYTETIVRNGFNGGDCRTVEVRNGNWENKGDGFYYKELDNSTANDNSNYIFEGNNIFYVQYTLTNTTYKVYYKRN